jgi:hypothetical protein
MSTPPNVKQPAIFQNKPFQIPYGRMNHLCCDWNMHMLTIVQNTFCNRHARWLPLVDKRFVIDKSVAILIIFLTWCDKQCCQARLRGLFLWHIVIKINETQLS